MVSTIGAAANANNVVQYGMNSMIGIFASVSAARQNAMNTIGMVVCVGGAKRSETSSIISQNVNAKNAVKLIQIKMNILGG